MPNPIESIIARLGKALNPNVGDEYSGRGAAEGRYRRASESALGTLALVMLAGLLALFLVSYETKTRATIFALCAVLAGASALIGALLGFLFGIPRTLQGDVLEPPNRDGASGNGEQRRPVGYRANTNLEQISDWLTKILVGVGLTQLTEIPSGLRSLSEAISGNFADVKGATLLVGGTVIYFSICGFLAAYLWTRLHLPSALRFADLDALGAIEEKLEENSRKLSELQQQAERDALALSYVEYQLNPAGAEAPPPTQEELDAKIAAASPAVKVSIFYRANQLRRENWRSDKAKMERTVSIFRALIASDKAKRFHRNHAQLGFALKDKRNPDWEGAIMELTEAIRIRNALGENGFRIYEANRAYCRISIEQSGGSQQSAADVKADIVQDIEAARDSQLGREVLKLPEVQQWAMDNGVSL